MCVQILGSWTSFCGDVTAWATVALAFVGAVAIIVNVFLIHSTSTAAAAARDAVALEREQLALFQEQLALTQQQFVAQLAAARPTLQAAATAYGSSFTEGTVTHVHGSQPAYEIEVWIRG